jgi:hypothetical protein
MPITRRARALLGPFLALVLLHPGVIFADVNAASDHPPGDASGHAPPPATEPITEPLHQGGNPACSSEVPRLWSPLPTCLVHFEELYVELSDVSDEDDGTAAAVDRQEQLHMAAEAPPAEQPQEEERPQDKAAELRNFALDKEGEKYVFFSGSSPRSVS